MLSQIAFLVSVGSVWQSDSQGYGEYRDEANYERKRFCMSTLSEPSFARVPRQRGAASSRKAEVDERADGLPGKPCFEKTAYIS
jgi:hypothetical protein